MTVMGSPRAAVCRLSVAPIPAKAPSPWIAQTVSSGLTRL
jgi:hypothetical protein